MGFGMQLWARKKKKKKEARIFTENDSLKASNDFLVQFCFLSTDLFLGRDEAKEFNHRKRKTMILPRVCLLFQD